MHKITKLEEVVRRARFELANSYEISLMITFDSQNTPL